MPVNTIEWKDHRLSIIDQTLLPGDYRIIELDSLERVWEAIKNLRIRGAPAIGVCAAFGVLVGLREKKPGSRDAALAAVWQMIPGAKAELEQRKAKRRAVLAELPPGVRQALELDDPQEADLAFNAALDALPPGEGETTASKLTEAGIIRRGGPDRAK